MDRFLSTICPSLAQQLFRIYLRCKRLKPKGKSELSTKTGLSYQLLSNINTSFKEQDDLKFAETSSNHAVDKAWDKQCMVCGQTRTSSMTDLIGSDRQRRFAVQPMTTADEKRAGHAGSGVSGLTRTDSGSVFLRWLLTDHVRKARQHTRVRETLA